MPRRPFAPKVVTANCLKKGDVIYLAADDTWVRRHEDAELIEDEAHAQIRLLDAERQQDRIVGPYLADARPGPHGPEPVHFRETFRTRGPSNYDHGKQADLTPKAETH
ncbi:MAG: DUF2849 domain-containing protein [Pseudomonadota bacterium]